MHACMHKVGPTGLYFLYVGGIRWPLFFHSTIFKKTLETINLLASIFGCSLLEMWALISVMCVVFQWFFFFFFFPFSSIFAMRGSPTYIIIQVNLALRISISEWQWFLMDKNQWFLSISLSMSFLCPRGQNFYGSVLRS